MFIEIPGIVEQLRTNDNSLRLGYFVGSGADAGKTGFVGSSTGTRLSRNGVWFQKGNDFGSVSAHFVDADNGETGTAKMTLSAPYAGKPAFYGAGYSLYYSPSEGKYIYARGNSPHEPNYVVDTLYGTTSGEYFWRTNVEDIPYRASDYDSVSGRTAIRGTLAGATDEWTSGNPRTISGQVYLPRYAYVEDSDDVFPAGKYAWVEDAGDYFHFGRLHYKDGDENVWDVVDWKPYTIKGPTTKIRYWDSAEAEPMGAGFYDYTSVENGIFHYADAEPEDETINLQGYSACSGEYRRLPDEDYTLEMAGHTIQDATASGVEIMMGEVSLWR